MQLQPKLTYETAQMLEQLKTYYRQRDGDKYSKSAVLTLAITETYDLWSTTDWRNIPVAVDNINLNSGALRPKLEVTAEINAKLEQAERLMTTYFEAKFVRNSAVIKYILRLALNQIQNPTNSINQTLTNLLTQFNAENYSDETKTVLKEYVDQALQQLNNNGFL